MQTPISREEKPVVVASPSDTTLADLCSRVIWMHDGKIKMDGPTEEVLACYREFTDGAAAKRK